MYKPLNPYRCTICLIAWTVPRRGLWRNEWSLTASGEAWARFDTSTDVWTTFLASSKGPMPLEFANIIRKRDKTYKPVERLSLQQ